MKALLGAFKKEKTLAEDFSEHYKTSRRFVDSSTPLSPQELQMRMVMPSTRAATATAGMENHSRWESTRSRVAYFSRRVVSRASTSANTRSEAGVKCQTGSTVQLSRYLLRYSLLRVIDEELKSLLRSSSIFPLFMKAKMLKIRSRYFYDICLMM